MNLRSMPQMAATLFKSRLSRALLAAVLVSTCGTAIAQDYQLSTAPLGFTSISGTGTDESGNFSGLDTGHTDVAVPFDFEFFGQPITAANDMLRLFTDGFVAFNNTSFSDFSPSEITSTDAENNSIHLFWDDTEILATGSVFQEVQGTAPNRVWVIEYNMVPPFSAGNGQNFDGQIAIFETTNVIELRYSTSTSFAPGPVGVGIKNSDGSIARGRPSTATSSVTPTENLVYTPAVLTTDLTISALSLSASGPFRAGDMVTVDFTVDNPSTIDSTAFDVGIYLSTDNVIEATDQLITTVAGITLTAGTDSVQSEMITIPMPNPVGMNGRQYFIGVLADIAMTQTENDTSNNGDSVSALVGPDPYVVQAIPQGAFVSIIGGQGTTVLADNTTPGSTTEVATVLPFDFRYFGQMIPANSPVAVSYDGYIELNDTNISTGTGFNGTLPRTSTFAPVNNPIFVFWDDLEIDAVGPSVIAEQVTGTAPNRQWIIEFNGMSELGETSADITFQVVLEETTNTIRFNYDPTVMGAGTAALDGTVGMQTTGGVEFLAALSGSLNDPPTTNFVFLENGNTNNTVDLSVSAVSVTQTQVNAAGNIDLMATIDNGGTSNSGMISYNVVLSTDNVIDNSDTVISSVSVTDVSMMSSVMEMQSIAIPTNTTPGMYFVGIVVNTGATPVLESDYFNNSAAIAAAIQIDAPGKDQGNLNGDGSVDAADVMFGINLALTDSTNIAGDVNNDATVNVLDVQIVINRVLNAP